ncbi:MAG: DUF748 domain-containing protein [Planctomycetes bacterium]|nr:DUF748 domain-containing protein [Planctomycetota bacterium]
MWGTRVAVGLVSLVLVVRLALVFALPFAAHWAGELVGLDVRLGEHRLSLLWGELELRDLTAYGPDHEPVLDVRRLLVDVSIGELLGGDLVVERVDLEGVRATLERDSEGRLTLLTTIEEALGPAGEEQEEEPEAEGEAGNTRIVVQRVSVRDLLLAWSDASVEPPLECDVRLSELTLNDWELAEPYVPQLVSLELGVSGVLEALRIEVVKEQTSAPWISAEVSLEGAAPASVRGYLTPLGLEPTGETVDLFLAVRGAYTGPLPERGELNRVELTVGGRRELVLNGLLVDVDLAEGLRVRNVELEGVDGALVRREDGALLAGGFEFTSDAAATVATEGAVEFERVEKQVLAQEALQLLVERLRLEDLQLRLEDRVQAPPVELAVDLRHAEVTGFELDLSEGAAPRAADFDLLLAVPGVVDSVAAIGSCVPSAARPRVGVDLALSGLEGSRLEPYLAPAGIAPIYTWGTAQLKLDAALAPAEAGGDGLDLSCVVREVDLSDGERRWLGWERLELVARDVTPDGARAKVDVLSLRGFSAEAEQRADGALLVGGFAVAPAADVAPLASHTGPLPADSGTEAAAGPVEPLRLADLLPTLELGRFDLGGARLTWITPARRLEVRPWRVHTVRPWSLPDDPLLAPPLELRVSLGLAELVEEVTLAATLSPFGELPTAALTLEAHGIEGPKLAQLSGGAFRAPALTHGVLGAKLEAQLSGSLLEGLDPLPALELTLSEVALEGSPEGPNLFVLERVKASGIAVTASGVTVERVAIDAPELSARRSEAEVVVCGFEFPLPPPAEPAPEPPPEAAVEASPAAPEELGAEPAFRFALGALDLEGAVLHFVDSSFDPPIQAPLRGGEVHVRDLRWPAEAGQPRLSASLRFESDPLGGDLGPAFEVLTAGAELNLYARTGTARLGLESLELSNLRGAARPSGVELGGGRASLIVDVKLRPDVLALDTELALDQLRLSEPAGGLLSSVLDLPLGLDSVVFLLRDESGLIEVPFSMDLPREGLSLPGLLSAALKTLGVVIGRAALRSPLRGLTSLKDLGGGFLGLVLPGEVRSAESIELRCLPGGVALSAEGEGRLERLIERARRERLPALTLVHHAGAEDAEAVRRVQSPSESDLRLAAARIDARLAEFERGVARARERALERVEEDSEEVEDARRALRRLEEGRASLIEGRDEVSAQLAELGRPRSERSAARRLRRGVVRLGASRLERLAERLMRVPGLQIRVQRPVHEADPPPGAGYVEVMLAGE